jgi:hypothetical protein
MDYSGKYNLLFYTAESFKSNEVRQFPSWVNIPPPRLQIATSPSNILIRQGEEQLIPARIKSTSGFSNDVINITLGGNSNKNYDLISIPFTNNETTSRWSYLVHLTKLIPLYMIFFRAKI